MNKNYVEVELEDGQTFTSRVVLKDKLALEKAAKANRWDVEARDAISAQTFVAFHATKREGHHALRWDEFREQCIDVAEAEDAGSDDEAQDDDTRPTQTAQSTDSPSL